MNIQFYTAEQKIDTNVICIMVKYMMFVSISNWQYESMAYQFILIIMFRVNRNTYGKKKKMDIQKNSSDSHLNRGSFFVSNKFNLSQKFKLKTQIDQEKSSKFTYNIRKIFQQTKYGKGDFKKINRKYNQTENSLRNSMNFNITKSVDRKKDEIFKRQQKQKLISQKYEILEQIGSGTFGTVFLVYFINKGRRKFDGKILAIKRVLQDKKYKNRELSILKILKLPNVIEMLDYWTIIQEGQTILYLVMYYYPQTLYSLIRKKRLQPPNKQINIKIYAWQLFRSMLNLNIVHVCHRDIKPHNILIDKNQLVICDFGSAKVIHSGQQNISYICSRCYRAPQLIFGSTGYDSKIDMWSMGCVLAQIIISKPIFIGSSSVNQLMQIIKILGTPTSYDIDQMNPQYNSKNYKIQKIKPLAWERVLKKGDPLLIDLISKILVFSPLRRLSAQQALAHEYFDQIRQQNIIELLNFSPSQIKQMGPLYNKIKGFK